jgi:hypothetical protein
VPAFTSVLMKKDFRVFQLMKKTICCGIAQSIKRRATKSTAGAVFPIRTGIIPVDTTLRPVLGPTQPPLHWAPDISYPAIRRQEHKADCS